MGKLDLAPRRSSKAKAQEPTMKDQDIRERIQTFLKETVRYVVVPASVGIGLALIGSAGCGSSESTDDKDAGTSTMTSTATGTQTGGTPVYSAPMGTGTGFGTGTGSNPVAKYMAVIPDAGQGQPEYSAPMPRDAAVYSAPMTSTVSGTGTGATATRTSTSTGVVALYMAVMPVDAGVVSRDAGQAVMDYMAPQPKDAGSSPVLRYMAVQPTSTSLGVGTGMTTVYSAPAPLGK
jgi:hypothetical protein